MSFPDKLYYRNAEENLAPFLRNSRWGDFLELWRELLTRYPSIHGLVERNACHLSFEMYGNRNSHLIEYKVPLETAVLFGVGGRPFASSALRRRW